MATETSSVGNLRRVSAGADEGVKAGHSIDVAEAIEGHPQAATRLAGQATPGLRRTMGKTAVIPGFAVQG